MCWKQEWASAIGNLEHAKVHISRAQEKLLKRKGRNEKSLERLRLSKIHNYPSELQKAQVLIDRNDRGIWQCDAISILLKAKQDELYGMIKVYGINRSENSQRLEQLMGKYVPPEKRDCTDGGS